MNVPEGVVILKGATQIFEFVNTEFEQLMGRTIPIGKTVRDVLRAASNFINQITRINFHYKLFLYNKWVDQPTPINVSIAYST